MLEFFSPILEPFCPIFVQIAQMVLILPRIPPPTPVLSLVSRHTPLSGICTNTKHPQNPSQNTPFPGLNSKVGKLSYSPGKLFPNWAICLKSGQNFSNKKLIHHVYRDADGRVPCGLGQVSVD